MAGQHTHYRLPAEQRQAQRKHAAAQAALRDWAGRRAAVLDAMARERGRLALAAYEAGMSVRAIATSLGVARDRVYADLHDAGIHLRCQCPAWHPGQVLTPLPRSRPVTG